MPSKRLQEEGDLLMPLSYAALEWTFYPPSPPSIPTSLIENHIRDWNRTCGFGLGILEILGGTALPSGRQPRRARYESILADNNPKWKMRPNQTF